MKTLSFFVALVSLSVTFAGYAQIVVDHSGSCYIGMKPSQTSSADNLVGKSGTLAECSGFPSLNIGMGINIIADKSKTAATAPLFTLLDSQKSSVPYFSITADGNIYSRNGIILLSEEGKKINIEDLSSTLSKIRAMKGISYSLSSENDFSLSLNPNETAGHNGTSRHFGLSVQEIETVCPEIVYTLNDSTKGIAYSELIAILVEGVKELDDSIASINDKYTALQERTTELQTMVETLLLSNMPQMKGAGIGSASGTSYDNRFPALQQRTVDNTTIEIIYRLNDDAQNASLHLYTLSGRQMWQQNLNTATLVGQVKLGNSAFEPGVYICTLVVNGLPVASEQITISNNH